MSTTRKPLTATEALRNIAAEAIERRRAQGLLPQHHLDLAAAVEILDPFDKPQQDRPQVLV